MPNRYFQLGDILNDTIGAAVFLWLAYSFLNNLPGLTKALSRWAAILLMMIPAIPIFVAAIDTWNMERNFPVRIPSNLTLRCHGGHRKKA